MGIILNAFANDNLAINPVTYKGNAEYRKAVKTMYETAEVLEKKLNEEEQKLFEQFRDAQSTESNLYDIDRFISGYRLGVLMTMEVFVGRDTFILGKEMCE